MKIGSTFDTNQAVSLKNEYERSFGVGNILLVRKSKYFFYRFIGVPVSIFLVMFMIAAYFVYTYPNISGDVIAFFWIIFLVYFLVLLFKVTAKWFDYKMDFLIITPKEVIKYNQTGVFTRDVQKILSDKLKTIAIQKTGMVNSFLNLGTLSFLAEGDKDNGDIVMNFIDNLENNERSIRQVLGMSHSK